MAILDILRRVNQANEERVSPVDPNAMTSAERELNSFREQQRQDNIKKELEQFRKKNSMLNDKQGMHQSILSQPASLFHNSPKHNILSKGSNILSNSNNRKEKNILSMGGGLFG